MASIQRRAADLVVEHLRERIVSGALTPGTRLDPTDVAGELGLSRTPVREAILRLDAEGLVERLPYRGVVVAHIDLRVAEDVAALRVHLETLAARLAVPRLGPDDLEQMRAAHHALADVLAGDGDPGRFNELNRAFHGALYHRAGSPVLQRTIDGLASQADRIRMHFNLRGSPAADQHATILAACERRDAEAAAAATRDHILATHLLLMPEGYRVQPGSALVGALHAAGTTDLSALTYP